MSPMSDNESTGKGSSSGWSKAVIAFAAGIAVTIGAILVIERGCTFSAKPAEGCARGSTGNWPMPGGWSRAYHGARKGCVGPI